MATEFSNTFSDYQLRQVIQWCANQRFPDDEKRDTSRKLGLLTVKPPGAAANPREFY
jgi:hypothetical protein